MRINRVNCFILASIWGIIAGITQSEMLGNASLIMFGIGLVFTNKDSQ